MGKQLCINRFGQRLCFAAKTIVSSKEGGGGVVGLEKPRVGRKETDGFSWC